MNYVSSYSPDFKQDLVNPVLEKGLFTTNHVIDPYHIAAMRSIGASKDNDQRYWGYDDLPALYNLGTSPVVYKGDIVFRLKKSVNVEKNFMTGFSGHQYGNGPSSHLGQRALGHSLLNGYRFERIPGGEFRDDDFGDDIVVTGIATSNATTEQPFFNAAYRGKMTVTNGSEPMNARQLVRAALPDPQVSQGRITFEYKPFKTEGSEDHYLATRLERSLKRTENQSIETTKLQEALGNFVASVHALSMGDNRFQNANTFVTAFADHFDDDIAVKPMRTAFRRFVSDMSLAIDLRRNAIVGRAETSANPRQDFDIMIIKEM